jgi:hypothetical protein
VMVPEPMTITVLSWKRIASISARRGSRYAIADESHDLIASARNAIARIIDREIGCPDLSQGRRVTVQALRLGMIKTSNHVPASPAPVLRRCATNDDDPGQIIRATQRCQIMANLRCRTRCTQHYPEYPDSASRW